MEKRGAYLKLLKKKNIYGETFFQLACNNGCVETVETIIKHRISLVPNYDPLLDHDNNLNTSLLSSIIREQRKSVFLLLNHGANANAENQNKQNGLHLSCSIGSYEITELLLRHGCNYKYLDKTNMNPLDYACVNGNVEIVKLLLQLEDARLFVNSSCLQYAIENNHPCVVDILLKSKYWNMLMKCDESSLIPKLIQNMVIKELYTSQKVTLN